MGTTLEHWIDGLQAKGTYVFLRSEAVVSSGMSPESVNKALQALARRGRVAKLKDYFYVIVPLEYASAGAPPLDRFVHDLMIAMRLPYYVGLLTAAGLHGASHQQPQEFQIVTDRSVRQISAGRARLRFFASKYVANAATAEMKTPTGAMRVSTAETTAVDLVRFSKPAGGLDNAATIVSELAEKLDARRLMAAVRIAGDVPNAQRLGFILDRIGARHLGEPIHAWIERQRPRPIPLRSSRPVSEARENRRWHVLVNGMIEVEA